mgnify:CR=1 FL=1
MVAAMVRTVFAQPGRGEGATGKGGRRSLFSLSQGRRDALGGGGRNPGLYDLSTRTLAPNPLDQSESTGESRNGASWCRSLIATLKTFPSHENHFYTT